LWHSTITLVAYDRDKDIDFRPLYESPIISVHDYCCHIARSGPGAEEESDRGGERDHGLLWWVCGEGESGTG